MDTGRNDLLGEIAADAALERGDFLVQATEQLRRFLDDLTGDWVSETEVIETASELVELYNPADVYAAFSEAAKEAAGLSEEPTATDDILDAAGIAPEETIALGDDPYAAAADSWAAGQPADVELDDDDAAARRLYDLALEYQERSQRAESRLLDDFEQAAATASNLLGELVIVDDDDERLVLTSAGEFRAEVVPEDTDGEWRSLTGPEQLVEFYDPTDVFGDLADALAEAYPAVAPELADAKDAGDGAADDATVADIDANEDDEDDEAEDDEEGAGAEGRPTA